MPEEHLFDAVDFILSLQVYFMHFHMCLYYTFAISLPFPEQKWGICVIRAN